MKITFKTNYDGKLYVEEKQNEELKTKGLTEEAIELLDAVADHFDKDLFDIVPDVMMFYIALPHDKVKDKGYEVAEAIYIKDGKSSIRINSDFIKEVVPENNDVLFTTREEAEAYAAEKNGDQPVEDTISDEEAEALIRALDKFLEI